MITCIQFYLHWYLCFGSHTKGYCAETALLQESLECV